MKRLSPRPVAALPFILMGVVGCAVAGPARHEGRPAEVAQLPASEARGDGGGSSPRPPTAPAMIVPAAPSATHYASSAGIRDRAALPPQPLREAILKAAAIEARRRRLPQPERDARLDLAMNDLARALQGDELPAVEMVDFLLSYYGIVEPAPHVLLQRMTGATDQEAGQRTAAQIIEALRAVPAVRIGIGLHRSGHELSDELRIVVALQEKNVEIDPIARHLAPGAVTTVAGRLARRFIEPRVVVTAPDGSVLDLRSVSAAGPGGSFRCELRCDRGAGRYQVEVAGVDEGGPTVLANFPVFCGVPPPATAPRATRGRQDPPGALEAEKSLLALVNRDRKAAGLPAVTLDGPLSAVAQAHSRDMSDHDFVAHVSPRTGTAVDRAQRAGLRPALLMENVQRAYSVEEAESTFMSSPGHRANILERRATRIGIGIVVGPMVSGATPLYVTQLFM